MVLQDLKKRIFFCRLIKASHSRWRNVPLMRLGGVTRFHRGSNFLLEDQGSHDFPPFFDACGLTFGQTHRVMMLMVMMMMMMMVVLVVLMMMLMMNQSRFVSRKQAVTRSDLMFPQTKVPSTEGRNLRILSRRLENAKDSKSTKHPLVIPWGSKDH